MKKHFFICLHKELYYKKQILYCELTQLSFQFMFSGIRHQTQHETQPQKPSHAGSQEPSRRYESHRRSSPHWLSHVHGRHCSQGRRHHRSRNQSHRHLHLRQIRSSSPEHFTGLPEPQKTETNARLSVQDLKNSSSVSTEIRSQT